MTWHGFGRSLVFAALAAVGWWVLQPSLGAILGAADAARFYLAGVVALYVLGLGPDRARALRASVGLGLGASILAALPLGFGTTCVALAIGLGVVRSGVLHRARPLRAWFTEALLLGSGLALARFLVDASIASLAFGLWGFFLVQSAFFLVGGISARPAEPVRDPFEQARSRLDALFS